VLLTGAVAISRFVFRSRYLYDLPRIFSMYERGTRLFTALPSAPICALFCFLSPRAVPTKSTFKR
jgi:hypothetical protein